MQGISIILCCYNSTVRLPETLRHICNLQVANYVPWEVIVVNNNSTDNTKVTALTLLKAYQCPAPYQVVDQPLPGLSHAREKGIETARYEYLLFCDDDNWLQEDYVQIVYEIMSQNLQIGALGGLIHAACEVDPPKWFEKFKGGYVVGEQGESSGDISDKKGYLFGAGMTINANALQLLQQNDYQSLLTGRKGSELTAGDDAELCYVLRLAGYHIWYDERLKIRHFIPKQRLTLDYAKKLYQGFGASMVVLDAYQQVLSGNSNINRFYWIAKTISYLKIFSIKFLVMEIFGLNNPPYFQWPYMIMARGAIKAYWQQWDKAHQNILKIQSLSKRLKKETTKNINCAAN